MTHEFIDIVNIAEVSYGDACIRRSGNAFSLVREEGTISFAAIPGDPALVIVRTRIRDISALPRKGDLAISALEGNFFWSGTNGGTLSVGDDGALWLTERRPVEELAAPEGLAACLSDFSDAAFAWRERSALHE